jgi:hypothetical protein
MDAAIKPIIKPLLEEYYTYYTKLKPTYTCGARRPQPRTEADRRHSSKWSHDDIETSVFYALFPEHLDPLKLDLDSKTFLHKYIFISDLEILQPPKEPSQAFLSNPDPEKAERAKLKQRIRASSLVALSTKNGRYAQQAIDIEVPTPESTAYDMINVNEACKFFMSKLEIEKYKVTRRYNTFNSNVLKTLYQVAILITSTDAPYSTAQSYIKGFDDNKHEPDAINLIAPYTLPFYKDVILWEKQMPPTTTQSWNAFLREKKALSTCIKAYNVVKASFSIASANPTNYQILVDEYVKAQAANSVDYRAILADPLEAPNEWYILSIIDDVEIELRNKIMRKSWEASQPPYIRELDSRNAEKTRWTTQLSVETNDMRKNRLQNALKGLDKEIVSINKKLDRKQRVIDNLQIEINIASSNLAYMQNIVKTEAKLMQYAFAYGIPIFGTLGVGFREIKEGDDPDGHLISYILRRVDFSTGEPGYGIELILLETYDTGKSLRDKSWYNTLLDYFYSRLNEDIYNNELLKVKHDRLYVLRKTRKYRVVSIIAELNEIYDGPDKLPHFFTRHPLDRPIIQKPPYYLQPPTYFDIQGQEGSCATWGILFLYYFKELSRTTLRSPPYDKSIYKFMRLLNEIRRVANNLPNERDAIEAYNRNPKTWILAALKKRGTLGKRLIIDELPYFKGSRVNDSILFKAKLLEDNGGVYGVTNTNPSTQPPNYVTNRSILREEYDDIIQRGGKTLKRQRRNRKTRKLDYKYYLY